MRRSQVELREGQTLSQWVMLGIQNGPQSLTPATQALIPRASSDPAKAWRTMEDPPNARWDMLTLKS